MGKTRKSTEMISNDAIRPTRREGIPSSLVDGGPYLPCVTPAYPWHVMQACRAVTGLVSVTKMNMVWEPLENKGTVWSL